MRTILLTILLFLFHVNCFKEYNEVSEDPTTYDNNTLDLGISKNYWIDYKKSTNFFMNIKNEDIYIINIHSINCNIEIDFKGEIISQTNLETYSLRINNESNNITINPSIDIIDGQEKENYELQRCYLIINNFEESQRKVKIDNKEETFFYFESEDSEPLYLSYELKDISNYSFVALSFQLNEKCNFSINITYNNQKDLIYKNIIDSSFIFLSSDILKNISKDNSNLNITINITKNDNNKAIKMNFKIIEKEIISMLQKNALNYGFITT